MTFKFGRYTGEEREGLDEQSDFSRSEACSQDPLDHPHPLPGKDSESEDVQGQTPSNSKQRTTDRYLNPALNAERPRITE